MSIQKSFLTVIIFVFHSCKTFNFTGIAWSQIPLGDYILVGHHVEGNDLADIHKKVEEGKNLMLTSKQDTE